MDRQLLQAILNNTESNSVGISFFSKGMKYLFVGTLVWQRTFVHVLIWMSDNLTILITMLQWVELCPSHPHHRFVRVWTPSISDCDLIWKQGLYRCNQIKMKSLGWVLIHSEHHPYQKGKLNTDTCTGRMPCEDEGRCEDEDEVTWGSQGEDEVTWRKPRNTKDGQKTIRYWERDMGQILPHNPRRNQPRWHLELELLASRTVTQYCLIL